MALSFDHIKLRKKSKVSSLGKMFPPLGVLEVLFPDKFGQEAFAKKLQEQEKKRVVPAKTPESYKFADFLREGVDKYQKGIDTVSDKMLESQKSVPSIFRPPKVTTKATAGLFKAIPDLFLGGKDEYEKSKETYISGAPEERKKLAKEEESKFVKSMAFSAFAPEKKEMSSSVARTILGIDKKATRSLTPAKVNTAYRELISKPGNYPRTVEEMASRYKGNIAKTFSRARDILLEEVGEKVVPKIAPEALRTLPGGTRKFVDAPPEIKEIMKLADKEAVTKSFAETSAAYNKLSTTTKNQFDLPKIIDDALDSRAVLNQKAFDVKKPVVSKEGAVLNEVEPVKVAEPKDIVNPEELGAASLRQAGAEESSMPPEKQGAAGLREADSNLAKAEETIDDLQQARVQLEDLEKTLGRGKFTQEIEAIDKKLELHLGWYEGALFGQGIRSPELETMVAEKTAAIEQKVPEKISVGLREPEVATPAKAAIEAPVEAKPAVQVDQKPPIETEPEPSIEIASQLPELADVPAESVAPPAPKAPSSLRPASNKTLAPEKVAVKSVIDAYTKAKPKIGKQELERAEELAIKFEEAEKRAMAQGGEAGAKAMAAAMKGKLATHKFESIRGDLTVETLNKIYDMAIKHEHLSVGDKLNLKTGLDNLFSPEGTRIPTKNEIRLMEEVYGEDFTKAIQDKKNLSEKSKEAIVEMLALPRAIMAGGFDLSFGFRQGIWAAYNFPYQWGGSFKEQFKWFASDEALKTTMQELRSRPNYPLYEKYNLLTDLGSTLGNREELYMSTYAERIPGLGIGVKASARAFTGFANKLRADMFDELVRIGKETGDVDHPDFLEGAASLVLNGTGRGTMPKQFDRAGGLMSTALFSPKLQASRINLLNPYYYYKLPPTVRKRAIRGIFAFIAGGMSVLGIAKAMGAEVVTEPTSSDFLKAKFGKIRLDPWGGFQQPVVLFARLWMNKTTSSTTGGTMTYGEGYKPLTRFDAIANFLTNKEAPIASFIHGLFRGTTSIGEEFKILPEIRDRFIPLFFQDLYELYSEVGPGSLGFAIPGFFGMGVQAYGVDTMRLVGTANKLEQEIDTLEDEGRYDEAGELFDKNQGLFKIARALEARSEIRADLKKRKKNIKKNTRIGSAEKQESIDRIDAQIEEVEEDMKEIRTRMEKELKPDFGGKAPAPVPAPTQNAPAQSERLDFSNIKLK